MKSLSKTIQLWDKALIKISDRLNDKREFDSFFDGSYINSIEGETITVVVNSSLAIQLMTSKYYSIISDAVSDLTETNYKFEFILQEDVNNKTITPIKKKASYFEGAVVRSDYTFDNFVVGPFNREASQAALLVARNPGKMFNPLFIHSESGLGKTHLLHAIGNYVIKEGNPNSKIIYITGNEFVEEYLKFVRGEKDAESLKEYVSNFDMLLFDDVQFLENKVNTQEAFFYIFQKMVQYGKQIVITADKSPNELKNIENRIITRFTQGLVINVKEPDETTCVTILEKKIESTGLDISKFDDAVLHFFANKFSSNIRELEGALNRLIFYIINNQDTDQITLDVAIKAVSSLMGDKMLADSLNEQKIINIVADYYSLTPAQLTGTRRTAQIALARHICWYLIRQNLDVPLMKIGSTFGGKDHTTISSGIQHVDNELKTNDQLKTAINELQKRIKG